VKLIEPDFDIQPQYAMADFALGIHKALKDCMPNGVFLHCRFHFWQLMNSKMRSTTFFPKSIRNCPNVSAKFKAYFNFKSKSNKAKKYDVRRVIRYDICILSKLPTLSLFNLYWKIITPFWKQFSKKFFELFKEDYIDNAAKNGWRNCISNKNPKTNNQIEGYNRALKQIVINKQLTNFNDYMDLIVGELESKSHESSRLPKFFKSPYVPKEFMEIAMILAKKFDDLFLSFQGDYYTKDSSINATFQAKNRGKPCTFFKGRLSKLRSGLEVEVLNSRFVKPSQKDVELYLNGNITLKQAFIQIAKIRRIEVKNPIDVESVISSVICSCPDHSLSYYCIHSLAVLFKRNLLHLENIPANEKRGRTFEQNKII